MSRIPAIPRVPPSGDMERRGFDAKVKEAIEVVTGRRGTPIAQLSSNASSAQIIAKINELIALVQGE